MPGGRGGAILSGHQGASAVSGAGQGGEKLFPLEWPPWMAWKRKDEGSEGQAAWGHSLYSTVRAWEEGLGRPARAVLLRMEGPSCNFPVTEGVALT